MLAGGGGSSLTSDCHCEGAKRLSQSHYRCDNAITTQTTFARNDRLLAFTLAEVLITLAIIGVVAAMTIPTLVANYQNKSWNTAATVFERKLEEALKTMNTQQTLAGYKNTEDFVNELSKHFKITKICKNDALTDCFEDKVYWGTENEEIEIANIKNASKFGQKDWDTETIGLQFANGTTGIVAYNPECRQDPYSNQITGTSCLALLYDTSGLKNPNTQNKDLRSINVTSLGGSNCAIELSDGTCFTAPFFPEPVTKAECEELADAGYGNKKDWCGSYSSDYWTGAVKACGGVNKMPTQAQLTALANDLYDKPISGSSTANEYATRDNDLAISMGFITNTSDTFWIWSGEESSKDGGYHRGFYSNFTYRDSSYRGDIGSQAVCLAD